MNETSARTTLTIYRRVGCHLCDDADVLLRDELASRSRAGYPGLTIEQVDITADAELEARYRHRIPVFKVGDNECELVTNGQQVRDFLDQTLLPA